MGTLVKYLLSLAVHAAWMRAGKGGATPPIRMPGKKAPVNLPVIGPWQMMLITWMVRKLWTRYGDDVKARVGQVDHPAARQIHDWIPTTRNAQTNAQAGNVSGTVHTPSTSAPTTVTIPPANNTRRLPRQTPDPNSTATAPTGFFSRFRKGS